MTVFDDCAECVSYVDLMYGMIVFECHDCVSYDLTVFHDCVS